MLPLLDPRPRGIWPPPAALVLAALLAVAGCDDSRDSSAAENPEEATVTGSAVVAGPEAFALPPDRIHDSNPLGLPAGQIDVAKGDRVFAVPERMLQGAKLGSSFALRAATVLGRDGDDVVLRVGNGAPYNIHPAYVVSLRRARVGRETPVIAAYRGSLHHGVVKGLWRDKVVVRYTDLGFKLPDQKLEVDKIGVLSVGVATPGGYAVYRAEHEYRHVLLVSEATHDDGKRRWLAVGHSGETLLLDADQVSALPAARFSPKVGGTVLAAWQGTMVPGTVQDLDRPGLYRVARPRTGPTLLLGPGMIMPPGEAAEPR